MCLYFGGNDFLGLITSLSCRSFFCQYECPLLVVREMRVSLLRVGLIFLSFCVLLSLFLFVACRGFVLDSEYKRCGACSLCLLVLVLSLQGVLLVFFFIVRFHFVCFLWGWWFPSWKVLLGVPAWRRSSERGGRGGLRASPHASIFCTFVPLLGYDVHM